MQDTLIGGNCFGVAILGAQQQSCGAKYTGIVRVDCRRVSDEPCRATVFVSTGGEAH